MGALTGLFMFRMKFLCHGIILPHLPRPTVDRRLSVPDGLSSVVPVCGFDIAPA